MAKPHETQIIDSVPPGSSFAAELGPEMPFAGLVAILARHKKLILGVTVAALLLTTVVAFLLPPWYRAEAVIMPPQQQSSSLSSLASGALSSLGGMGFASELGLKNQAEVFIGILKSRTVADEIATRYRLDQVYQTHYASDTRRALEKHTSVAATKDTLIHISVEDRDPQRAVVLANAYVDELYKQNSRLALTEASQRRLFFDQQLAKEKDSLADAEVALKNTQQSTGLVVPSGQGEVLIRSVAQVRAEIASREVELQAMRSYATEENPQVQVLKREITTLRSQLGGMESKGGSGIQAGKLPEAGLEYIRKMRDVKYHETLFEVLAKQYESARMDEAKSAPLVQTIDRAIVPDKKSWPPRALLIAAAGALGFILAAVWVILSEAFRTSQGSVAHDLR